MFVFLLFLFPSGKKCSNIETAPRGRDDELVIGDAMGRSILGQWDHRVNTGHPGLFFFLLGGGSQLTPALINNGSAENWDASLRNTADYLLLLLKL